MNSFGKSLLTGGVATLADLGVLTFAIGFLHTLPAHANVPALLAGGLVQFVGNRHFAFRATSGSLRRQIIWFTLTEIVALSLNALLFHLAATHTVLDAVGAVGVRVAVSALVYVLWSYPVWRRVFAPKIT